MLQALTIAPAGAPEQAAAFRLIFQYLDENERDSRVGNALRLLQAGELDSAGLLVARTETEVLGALICLPLPGAAGLVWPPQTQEGSDSTEIEDRLLQEAIAWLRQRGAKLGQALLGSREVPLAASLLRNGFQHVTSLWYLRHDLNLSYAFLRLPERLTYQTYPQADPVLFRQTLLRTYQDSLDCPEVSGVRDVEETLEGHRAQGAHDPERWWLALDGTEPVGVLLLTHMQDWQAWEVAYVGVVPEQRRRGWGRELMHKALCEAHAGEAAQVTLSVDGRNRPAWKLYLDLGFEPYDQREVYLAIWR